MSGLGLSVVSLENAGFLGLGTGPLYVKLNVCMRRGGVLSKLSLLGPLCVLGGGWFLNPRLPFPCCSITLFATACYFPIATQIRLFI